MKTALVLSAFVGLSGMTAPPLRAAPCQEVQHEAASYIVCRYDPETDDIKLFLYDGAGEPYGHFNRLSEALAETGERLVFAMNAGMYALDRAPVGLYVENYEELARLNTNDGPGNFHLKPNGVFFIDGVGKAFVLDTSKFVERFPPSQSGEQTRPVAYATQSGPMLAIDGAIHPRFLPDSDSLKRRNGVGVTEGGEAVFVLADAPVRLYDFAVFFRDELKTPNALYLDGTISRLYAPELGRNDPGLPMGPIVGVVTKAAQ